MKCLLILVLIAFTAAEKLYELSPEIKAELRQAENDCLAISPLTNEELDAVRHYPTVGQNDPKVIKHLICFYKKLRYLNDDNTINTEVTRTRLTNGKVSEANVDRIVKECVVNKNNVEETVANFIACKRQIVGNTKYYKKN